jgi:zinc/manganese transport system substrate-binding protein
MKRMILAAALAALAVPAQAGQISVVAAENFYGDVARQIAGPDVSVASILSNPDQDPHMFEASPSVARALSGARIVIYNGADYDPWMDTLLAAARSPDRQVIVVANLVGKQPGDNPHLWYDTATVAAAARALSAAFTKDDPDHADGYARRLQTFLATLQPIDAEVGRLRAAFHGTPVIATEPVFGYMASAIGLDMHAAKFQMAVMNDTEPSASDVAAFEGDLRQHRVKVMLYNSQATDGAARRLLHIAEASGVPVVGVSETEPLGKSYQAWMTGQLDALGAALAKPGS